MNGKLRKRLIDGITVISNPLLMVAVVALMLLGGWLAMDELTPMLWVIAGAYFLLALIGGQLAKGSAGHSPD